MRSSYTPPDVAIPATYPHADESAKASLDRCWQRFGDSNLNGLVAEALRSNMDLALADLNVRAARLQTHLVALNPTLAAGYTYDYSAPPKRATPPTLATEFHSLTGSASYEVDMWDQLTALKDVARWEAKAAEEDRQSVALTLIESAVNFYFELADLNHRIKVSSESIEYAARSLELVRLLKSAGGATAMETAEAEQNLASQQTSQAAALEQRVEIRNALRVVLNNIPWPESQEAAAVPEHPPPAVTADLPASLLQRRPDLRAAELRLHETLAQTDATRLGFYPTLSLTGSLNTGSTGLPELISNPLGTLAATLAAPFIQINQAHFATAFARIQYDKAAVSYRKTLIQALIDVDTALAARTQLAEEAVHLDRSLESARISERFYEIRYRAGAVPLRPWLDAQEARRQAENVLSSNHLSRVQNYAALCQALGGDPADIRVTN